MGNYVSCNCSCACIKATSQKAYAASDSKRKVVQAITVVHFAEERVIEMGGGAPMKVAELMLEFSGHFVVECETDIATQIAAINTGTTTILVKRATPLPADQEVSPGRIYILFPMHRLHTRVAPHENTFFMGLLTLYVSTHLLPCSKKKSLHSLMQASSAKVTPLSSLQLEEIPPHLTACHSPAADTDTQFEDEIDQLLQQFCSSQSNTSNSFSKCGSLVRSKSWIPKLETICE